MVSLRRESRPEDQVPFLRLVRTCLDSATAIKKGGGRRESPMKRRLLLRRLQQYGAHDGTDGEEGV